MASRENYSIACIELFRRLWVELERLSEEAMHPCAANAAFGPRTEMLRLELALLLDACSERWRQQLDVSQQQSLRSTLEEVLGALNSSSEVSPDAIAWSQNRLFDALLDHCATCAPAMEVHAMRRAAS